MIIQVLVNLIDNAIKSTPPGGTVTVRLHETDALPTTPGLASTTHGRGPGRAALITVADTGIGIAEEHLPHIFDRFYRVETGRARSRGGSGGLGLGLAICQAIAHAHGGTLTAVSTPGEGATFSLMIPQDN
jgi:two-component system sensor histidine kinase BaeS